MISRWRILVRHPRHKVTLAIVAITVCINLYGVSLIDEISVVYNDEQVIFSAKPATAVETSALTEGPMISPLNSIKIIKERFSPEVVGVLPSDVNMEQEPNNRSFGVQFLHQLTEVKTSNNSSFDVLSIGSVTQIELLQAQSDTWASHSSIGNFFGATENDDPDPNCYKTLTLKKAFDRSKYCRREIARKKIDPLNILTEKLTSAYATTRWLKKKANPAAWMCAQRRPPFALAKLLRFYREGYNIHGDTFLPSYLIVTDDDTFIDIALLEEKLMVEVTVGDSALIPHHTTPVVFAGCRIRHPINEVNFTFPYGGYGQFFSRGALLRMIQPLYCNNTSLTGFEQEACERINDPKAVTIEERKYFEPGMSVSDLMEAYTAAAEFCSHSDWITAYFVNFYNISRHVVDDGVWLNAESRMDNVKEARFHTFDKSEIYRSNVDVSPGHCGTGDFKACTHQSMICHRQSSEDMKQRTTIML